MAVVISNSVAKKLLAEVGVRMGSWNELRSMSMEQSVSVSLHPPVDAGKLLDLSCALASEMTAGSWALLHFDNSMSPTSADESILRQLFVERSSSWDVEAYRTSLVEGQQDESFLMMMMFFGLLLCWHFHVVSEAKGGQCIVAIQDGLLHLIGNLPAIDKVRARLPSS